MISWPPTFQSSAQLRRETLRRSLSSSTGVVGCVMSRVASSRAAPPPIHHFEQCSASGRLHGWASLRSAAALSRRGTPDDCEAGVSAGQLMRQRQLVSSCSLQFPPRSLSPRCAEEIRGGHAHEPLCSKARAEDGVFPTSQLAPKSPCAPETNSSTAIAVVRRLHWCDCPCGPSAVTMRSGNPVRSPT